MKEDVDNTGHADNDTELGNYRILTRDGALWTLGKGAFGTTYKAEHKHLGGAYALKIINDQFNDSDQVKERFLREAKATFSLSSTKIARVHDFGVEGGVFYYVLDYCDGGNLQEYSLKNGAQPWSVVKLIALQILEAVSEAHKNGFLHRDLKPSNIMLQNPDDIALLKLIDFGMVKALENSGVKSEDSMLTVQGSFMGNPLTASPEQLHELELDERSDLFSLGVTLWYVLCGGSPFGEAATASLVHTRLQEKEYLHELPDGLPEDGKFIMGKLLNKKKEDRFKTAEDVIQAIREERKEEPEVVETEEVEEKDLELELIHKFSYGCYYHATDEEENTIHTLYKPNSLSVPDLEQALLNSNLDGNKVLQFTKQSEQAGERVYFCEPLPRNKLSDLLKSQKKLSIEDYQIIFERLGAAIDQASDAGFEQLELDDKFIHLGFADQQRNFPQSKDEWAERLGADQPDLEVTILPRLAPNDESEMNMKTIAGEDLAPDSLTGFAALIYRLHTGMPIKQTAFLSKSAFVPSSLLSEKSNDYLRDIIVSSEVPSSCSEMFHHLYELEVNGKSPGAEETKVSNEVEMKPPTLSGRFKVEDVEQVSESVEAPVKAPLTSTPAELKDDEVVRKSEGAPAVKATSKPVQKEKSSGLSSDKIKGVLAAVLLVATGIMGCQFLPFWKKSDDEKGSTISAIAENDLPKPPSEEQLDPAVAAQNAKIEQELLEKIAQIKTLVSEKEYTTALDQINDLDVDTVLLKEEIAELMEEERAYNLKKEEERSKLAERQAELEGKQKQDILETEKKTAEAKLIWDKETATQRDMLQLANAQKENSLNFIATNKPQVEIIKRSDDGSIWEAKVVLKRPGNQPKNITLKFNKNKLLKSNSDAVVKVIGPHIERVDGKKLLEWELVVKDAVIEKQLEKAKHLVNEQKKTLFLKEQSIREKYPEFSEYFPQ